jgi:outer membrane protein assembly factor BamB
MFIGIRGSVVALDRATGKQVWATHLKGWSFVNVIRQNDMVVATCYGEVFCLDPATGTALWHNPLKGFGTGLATIANDSNQTTISAAAFYEQERRQQAAASAAAA